MGCSQGLARILVFIANFAFLLAGLALLVLGIFYKVRFTKVTDAIPSDYSALQHVPIIAIVVGAVIFFIAFLGCCGAMRNNTCMLSWYGAILIIIFLAQLGLGIFALIKINDTDELSNQIINQFQTLVSNYFTRETYREVVDFIQQNLKCCGTTGPSSWATPPASCYPDNTTTNTRFNTGCNDVLPEFISDSIRTIGIVALVISVTEVVGAVLALCLAGCIRESRRQGAYY